MVGHKMDQTVSSLQVLTVKSFALVSIVTATSFSFSDWRSFLHSVVYDCVAKVITSSTNNNSTAHRLLRMSCCAAKRQTMLGHSVVKFPTTMICNLRRPSTAARVNENDVTVPIILSTVSAGARVFGSASALYCAVDG